MKHDDKRDELAKAIVIGLLASGQYSPEKAVAKAYVCANLMLAESNKHKGKYE